MLRQVQRKKLETARRDLSAFGQVETLQVNLYEADDLQHIVAFAENHGQHIKYLVNAAGYFKPTPFLEHTHKDYETYLDLNRALFLISQAVAKNMAANGGGSMVHIGWMWATPSSAYSMAKAGLHALTQHMAMELADHNIRVNPVSPAVVKTLFTRPSLPPIKSTKYWPHSNVSAEPQGSAS